MKNLVNRRFFSRLVARHLPIQVVTGLDHPTILTGSGLQICGPSTSEEQRIVHRLYRLSRHFPLDYFGIVDELVDRYDVPRSFGGEIEGPHLDECSPRYRPYRDPFSDFDKSVSTYLIKNHWKPVAGDVVVDIGAYQGLSTLRMLQEIGEGGKLIAVEGDLNYFNQLRQNLQLNWQHKNFFLINSFASSSSAIREGFSNDEAMVRSLELSTLEDLKIKNLKQVLVPTRTIDEILESAGLGSTAVNYASITVNGHEPEVLEGMLGTIDRSPHLTISLAGWYRVRGKLVADVVTPWLEAKGFEVHVGRKGRVLARRRPEDLAS